MTDPDDLEINAILERPKGKAGLYWSASMARPVFRMRDVYRTT
jgi:hypothetical protein